MTSYATVDELQVRTNMVAVLSAAKETEYEEIIEAISRKIDRFCRRPDGFVATAADETRYFLGSGKRYLRIPECTSITTVSVKDSYSDTTYDDWDTPTTVLAGDGDWFPSAGGPSRPIYNRTPYTLLQIDSNGDYTYFTKSYYGMVTVKIAAKWGYATTVPADIQEACLAQAAILIKRFEASMDTTAGSSDLGTIVTSVRAAALTRDVRELLVDSKWVLPLYAGGY